MTNPNPPARLFRLTSWERLESLAAQHAAIAKSGPNAGQPSIHTLLAAIEAGALDVVAAEPAQPAETTPQPAATA